MTTTVVRGAVLCAVLAAASAAFASNAVPVAAPAKGAAPAATPAMTQQQKDQQVIEGIQKDAESVLTGRHFSYDPAGRRDPFEPLVKNEPNKPDGKRPKGVAGMLVNEIDLRGIATDIRGNPVAMFRGSDNRGYTLRVGDIVYDGRVISIDPRRGMVVFRQQVDDPRRIKPYRDVIKRLQVTGGEDSDSAAEEEGA